MREFFHKLQMVTMLALGCMPIVLILFAYFQPSLLPWAWVYPSVYLVLTMIGIRVPGKMGLLYGGVVAALSLAFVVLVADRSGLVLLLIATVLYVILFLWSLSMRSWPSTWELPAYIRLFCFAIHVLAQLVVMMDNTDAQPYLVVHAPALRVSFMAFLLLMILSINRDSMNKAAGENRSVSRGMREKNTVLTLVLFALAIALSFIPYIYDWAKMLVLWFVQMLVRLMSFQFPEKESNGVVVETKPAIRDSAPMEVPEPSMLSQILETIFMVFGCVMLLALVLLGLYLLVRGLIKLLRRCWSILEKYAAAVSEDFQDEITDTRRDDRGERAAKRRRAVTVHRGQRKNMRPLETIRYRYQRLMCKHPEWSSSATARENIPLQGAQLYERARYSGYTITESEAEQFQSETKGL